MTELLSLATDFDRFTAKFSPVTLQIEVRRVPFVRSTCLALACSILSLASTTTVTAQIVQWPIAGQGASDLRSQPDEYFLGATNVSSIVPKWIFTTVGDVSATPTVSATTVFAPDWSGNIFAIDLATGAQIWSHHISDCDGYAGATTRVSPALYNNSIIVGDNESGSPHGGANVISIDQQTGAMLWMTNIDPHPAAIITGSPVVVGHVIYQGVSSIEEGLVLDTSCTCCTFRGSIVALDADTGTVLWRTFTVPDNHGQPGGYRGAPIWQSPAVDVTRNLVYVGTGNNYSAPASVEKCRLNNPKNNNCVASVDHFDSALALDLNTGTMKWARRLSGYDVWNAACESSAPTTTCPDPAGPDYDLGGSGPNLFGNAVGFGQKSGLYAALDADTGNTLWSKFVGPAGSLGGIQWGTASDGTHIYIASANSNFKPYKLVNGQQITWGFWSALDAVTGKILWQTPDPTPGTMDESALSVANGVVYAGSFDSSGHMYALNSANGQILWSYASGGSVIGSPSIVNGNLFWGSGYTRIKGGTGNNKVYDLTPAPAVTVTSPVNGSLVKSPVQFTASASSLNCPSGVSSMRIYTAPGQIVYTGYSSSLSVSLSLSPGTYNTVVQSWDNCGNVGKTFITITVSNAAH